MIAVDIEVGTGDSGGAVLVRRIPAGVASRSFDGFLGFTHSPRVSPNSASIYARRRTAISNRRPAERSDVLPPDRNDARSPQSGRMTKTRRQRL
jgi:hypothetical protein